MTEAEWLMSDDPVAMGDVAERRKRATERVLRLYCATYWAWVADRLRTPADREELRAAVALCSKFDAAPTTRPSRSDPRRP